MGAGKPERHRRQAGRLIDGFDLDPRDSAAAADFLALIARFDEFYLNNSTGGVFYGRDCIAEKNEKML